MAVSVVKVARDPGNPTKEEVEAHNCCGHVPYRPWCEVCVEARGREDPHMKKKEPEILEKPQVGLDYKSFGESDVVNDKQTMIVVRDRESRMTFSHSCVCKGCKDEWIVKSLIGDMETMGHTELIIKTDGEPALINVVDELQRQRGHRTIPQHPPAYDPQANGAIEKAVDDVVGQIRALKLAWNAG